MHPDTMVDVLEIFASFGGIALIIWTSAKAKLMHRQMDVQTGARQTPFVVNPQNDPVLAELRSLKEQVSALQATGHQFDLAFDAALERMEERVVRLETKATASIATPFEPSVLRNGTNTGG